MEAIAAILEAHQRDPTRLVQVLREVQQVNGNWLSPHALTEIAHGLSLPRAKVEGVAGFYSFLHLSPVGQFRVLVSDDVTDHHAGSRELLQTLAQRLQVEVGKVRSDGRVSIEVTSCTGLCDQAPGVLVNGVAVGRVSGVRLDELVSLIERAVPVEQWPSSLTAVDAGVRREGLVLGLALEPGHALTEVVHRSPAELLQVLVGGKLRGRGGAGFPLAQKWEACRTAKGESVIVCNADEGEPGTFKDRALLMKVPDTVVEGMTIAARFTGATRGFIYLRGEYEFLRRPLEACLARRRQQQLLGASLLGVRGFDFDVELHLGAGAYVCGEETALLESLEGRRGVPRHRPPFPTTVGYRGRPTIVNNVETFADVATLFARGLKLWLAQGTPESTGSKLFSVAGDVARPGVYEMPWGVTVADLLALSGGSGAKAVQVGGPSGELVGPSEFSRRLCFEDLPCAGAIAVLGPQRDLLDAVVTWAHFFAHESCGFCTPCRVGTHVARRSLDALRAGRGSASTLSELDTLTRLLRDTSHCGLGATAPNAWRHYLTKFPDDVKRRLGASFHPAFDVEGALETARHAIRRGTGGAT